MRNGRPIRAWATISLACAGLASVPARAADTKAAPTPPAQPAPSRPELLSIPDVPPPSPSPPAPLLPEPIRLRPLPRGPAPIRHLPVREARGILGREILGPKGGKVGRLVDVMVDAQGRPRAALIDFGGFMGVGDRRIAVDWSALRFNPADANAPIRLDLTPAEIKGAPEYQESGRHSGAVVTPDNAPPDHDDHPATQPTARHPVPSARPDENHAPAPRLKTPPAAGPEPAPDQPPKP